MPLKSLFNPRRASRACEKRFTIEEIERMVYDHKLAQVRADLAEVRAGVIFNECDLREISDEIVGLEREINDCEHQMVALGTNETH